jgi:hypothetical protein
VAVFLIDRSRKGDLLLNLRIAFWLASGAVVFAFTFGGCQKKEEAMSVTPAPAVETPAGSRDVASAPAGKTNPGTSASGNTTTPSREEAGEFF